MERHDVDVHRGEADVSSGVVYFIWYDNDMPQYAVVPRSEIRKIETASYSITITLTSQEDVSIGVEPDNSEPADIIKRMFTTLVQSVDTDITWTMDKDGDWAFAESRPQ